MSSPASLEALRLLRRAYGAAPVATRLHVLGRFLSCPFLRVLDYLPPGAKLLDLGAGHGIFAHLSLAAGAPAATSAVAVEPDGRKVFHIPRHPSLRVVNGYHEAVRGSFGAVTVFDVLYRLPGSAWDPLLGWARQRLAPGGVFLLKEIDPEHRTKALWNRAQERGADLLGLTLGEAFSYETRDEIRARLLRAGFEGFQAVDIGAGYPHAHILYVARG
ncbi:MAG TPA: methyltransferase domain-containing protein [Thermoanaerobaculia bacterium]